MPWPEPSRGGGGLLAEYRNLSGSDQLPWRVRRVPVCASTEPLLTRWLHDLDHPDCPCAVQAVHQTRATGQRGRPWSSPRGGLWISAALPWNGPPPASTELLGLAIAVSMAQRLERRGLCIRIKWPNDLLVDGRKLAGLLPRLVFRGSRLRLVRVGFGLNVANRAPTQAIALRQLLGSGHGDPEHWGAQLLVALDHCMRTVADRRGCLTQAEARLWREPALDPQTGRLWQIMGLDDDGALRVCDGQNTCRWMRWPSP